MWCTLQPDFLKFQFLRPASRWRYHTALCALCNFSLSTLSHWTIASASDLSLKGKFEKLLRKFCCGELEILVIFISQRGRFLQSIMGGPSHISPNLPEGLRKNMEKFQVRIEKSLWQFLSIITNCFVSGQEHRSSLLERYFKDKIVKIH